MQDHHIGAEWSYDPIGVYTHVSGHSVFQKDRGPDGSYRAFLFLNGLPSGIGGEYAGE